jgi:hypothetical protein
MAERRPLIQGLKDKSEPIRAKEEEFVYGADNKPAEPAPQPPVSAAAVKLTPSVGRVSFSTKMRADIAQALKRASLDRQLQGVEPNTVQEIVEDALEPWLYREGYLT